MTDILQVLAILALLYSIWYTGNKQLRAPVTAFFSEALWIAIGIRTHVWGIWVTAIILTCLYLRNIIKWRKEKTPW